MAVDLGEQIWAAMRADNRDLATMLLANEEAVNIVNTKKWWGTPMLSHAAREGQTKIVEILISMGAYVNQRGENERPPLWYAASEGKYEAAALLVRAGADVNAQVYRSTILTDVFGSYSNIAHTPDLRRCRQKIVELLVRAGANINAARGNYTVFTYAYPGRMTPLGPRTPRSEATYYFRAMLYSDHTREMARCLLKLGAGVGVYIEPDLLPDADYNGCYLTAAVLYAHSLVPIPVTQETHPGAILTVADFEQAQSQSPLPLVALCSLARCYHSAIIRLADEPQRQEDLLNFKRAIFEAIEAYDNAAANEELNHLMLFLTNLSRDPAADADFLAELDTHLKRVSLQFNVLLSGLYNPLTQTNNLIARADNPVDVAQAKASLNTLLSGIPGTMFWHPPPAATSTEQVNEQLAPEPEPRKRRYTGDVTTETPNPRTRRHTG